MKIKFSYIIAFSAFFVASCAAFFSVFGLSQLFAGAQMAVVIMASSLEFSKIIGVSLLQRYWGKLSKWLRIYLSIGMFVLVCITSAGIYGFLSNAYQKTASKYQISENDITILNNKKDLYDKNIASNQVVIDTKTKRAEQLGALRSNQETRLDSAKGAAARARVRSDINNATTEIQALNKDIDNLNTKNSVLLDSSNAYSSKSIDSKSKSTGTSEIGPLKYLAALTGYPMDKVVNWFILLLIFVFDPLAVALVISFNRVMELEREADAIKATAQLRDNIVDPVTGDINLRYNQLPIEQDFFIPSPGTPPVIERLPVQPATLGEVGETTEPINVYHPEPITEHIEEVEPVEGPDIEETEKPEEPVIEEPKVITSIEAPDDRVVPKVFVPVVEQPKPQEAPDARYVKEEPRRLSEEETTKEAMAELTRPEAFKSEPVIPNGKIELQDIKEIKEINRANGNNAIERIK